MDFSISFLELRIEAGKLVGTLGSGPSGDVLARNVSEPYVRICMRDPLAGSVRVRCGTAKLTDSGLDYSGWDEFQNRGASIRLFARTNSTLQLIDAHSNALREFLQEREYIWLEINEGVPSRIDESTARRRLSEGVPDDELRILITFQVPRAHADEMFALLRTNCGYALEE